jgi:DNA-binding response OmpR family regulator
MKTLLVLEDEPDVMEFRRHMLEQYGLSRSSTEEQAVRLFSALGRQVDLLVADLTLPRSSGIQVALHLRSQVPDLPVILTSMQFVNCLRHGRKSKNGMMGKTPSMSDAVDPW